MSDRPWNVIILHCDEMRGDCAGFAGNRQVKTPRLDAFARDAVVLARHFTVHGKCIPSRVAMMTGRYAMCDGVRTVMEEDLLPAHRPDLMKTLKARGFETAVFGVNHCWSHFFNDNKPHGTVDWHSFIEGDFHAISSREILAPAAGNRPDTPILADGFDLRGRILGALPAFSDDVKAEAAMHYLRQVRDRNRPFFLQLNLGAPHPPYAVEEPWFSLYDPVQLTPFPRHLPRNASLPFRAQREHRTGSGEIAESAVQAVLATYYGMISKVDSLMGQVLDCLHELGIVESSIIIFTSDHGDFAGQYGLCEKFDTVLADCLLRVPCVIRAPGLPRSIRCDALTQHIDLPPTILELLGMKPDAHWGIQGSSLAPVIEGKHRPKAVFADGGHESSMRTRFNGELWTGPDAQGAMHKRTAGKQHTYALEPESMARCSMVRSETHKLVMRETGEHELYDLIEDPWELDNCYRSPHLAATRDELMEQLVRWHLRTCTDQPFHPHVMA